MELHVAHAPQPRSLSVITFAPFFVIPAGLAEHNVSDSCCIEGFEPLMPLAARVHAHDLGRMISLAQSLEPVIQNPDWLDAAVRLSPCFEFERCLVQFGSKRSFGPLFSCPSHIPKCFCWPLLALRCMNKHAHDGGLVRQSAITLMHGTP